MPHQINAVTVRALVITAIPGRRKAFSCTSHIVDPDTTQKTMSIAMTSTKIARIRRIPVNPSLPSYGG